MQMNFQSTEISHDFENDQSALQLRCLESSWFFSLMKQLKQDVLLLLWALQDYSQRDTISS